jgi:hypothetical protein
VAKKKGKIISSVSDLLREEVSLLREKNISLVAQVRRLETTLSAQRHEAAQLRASQSSLIAEVKAVFFGFFFSSFFIKIYTLSQNIIKGGSVEV